MFGCTGNYGRIQWDADVTEAFETNQVNPDYQYYFYGVGMQTYAVVGLDPKWEMNSIMWRSLQSDTEEFKVTTSRIWDNDYVAPYYPRGAHIIDASGDRVGVYYSSLIYPTVKFETENQVSVILDTAFLWGPGDPREP